MADRGVVVPVERTETLRSTVSHVVESADEEGYTALHFVYLAPWRSDDPHVDEYRSDVESLLEQVAVWAEYDLEEAGLDGVEIVTAVVGDDSYLFGPPDFAERLVSYAEAHDVDGVVLDPEYTPVGNTTLLQPLEFELASTPLTVREAPVERPTRRERLTKELTGWRFLAVFGVSLLFYMVLGDPTYAFDWITGIASAAIVAISLASISLDHEPRFPGTPLRLLRGMVYVPVLLYEVLKSNVVVAAVILHPRLPIDPTMNRVRVLVGSGLPLTTLANSITLTPGTLTVRASDQNLYVHSLIPWARDGLFEGSLERWTRLVFYGRDAARLPTPDERDDVAILQGPDATEELPIARADGGAGEADEGGDSAVEDETPADDAEVAE